MPKLFLVPTPIGNLEDITLRSIRVLREADLILAEDTRTSGILLRHLDIQKTVLPYHQHNEHKVADSLVRRITSCNSTALVTDAGTPGISDPGFLIVKKCLEAGISVETLPGPTAFVPALVNSGLAADRFCFEGFLPHKKGRVTRLKALAAEKRTFILYESPHRLMKTLEQLREYLGGDRHAGISRELSKMYEENFRGTLDECIRHFSSATVKGEIVIVVEGCGDREISGSGQKDSDTPSPEE